MKLTYIDDGRYVTIETDSLDALYDKRDEHLGEQKRKAFATDMDGVLEPDDLAITKYDILYPVNGVEKFQEISNGVLVPAREGRC
ncbi:MAG: hypothetical protein ISS36_03895, partial [Candidatus Aenigmarchaeota archaeon]|nr:hypothetical protein [Candidatus Aenigmarchaeota archaeon]